MKEFEKSIFSAATPLYSFLVGEAKLENYLEENPLVEKNIDKARTGLTESKNYLSESITEQGEKVNGCIFVGFSVRYFTSIIQRCFYICQCGVALDGHLLLGKLQYAIGDYESALDHFNKAGLHKLNEKTLAARSIRIISESFAIKGTGVEVSMKLSINFDFVYLLYRFRFLFGTSTSSFCIQA